MAVENEGEIQVGTRVSKTLHAAILKHQREAKRLTGIEPSVSAVIRAILEQRLLRDGRRSSKRSGSSSERAA